MRRMLPHPCAPGPAALALLPAEGLGRHDLQHEAGDVLALVADPARGRGLAEARARDVEEGRQEGLPLGLEERAPLLLGRARHEYHRVDAFADLALLTCRLERARDLAAHLEQALPVRGQPLVRPLPALLREEHEVHALRLAAPRDVGPDLVRGEREYRRHQAGQRGEQLEAYRLGRAAPRIV